ncbi:UPF0721 transmembrane protein [Novimethylophilus kurashikiensis]|uniref:UPF0721 transmembrane protein n=1 Tax=Novimethylophilus kurashikiensis TaxID=1825523 RepID=A0A2R5FEA0_9PROT|nr:hypothetical protein [Novimethylophilus kurashikiensis]GBG14871.1 UPF0721 transmembrane protein [Novimethylophilus kurashikiensis]
MTYLVADVQSLVGQEVEIYRNLHKPHGTFSVRVAAGPNRGRVLAHVQHIELKDVTFKVSAAGREKVRATRRKLVHAVVRGEVTAVEMAGDIPLADWLPVRYNPYETDTFIRQDTQTPIAQAAKAIGVSGRVMVAK